MDFPLISESHNLLKIANSNPQGEEFLRTYLTKAETHHEFAACFLALWEFLGYYPIPCTNSVSNRFIEQSIGLATAIKEQLGKVKVQEVSVKLKKKGFKEKISESCQNRLTTSVTGIQGGYILPLSDMARRQAQSQRELDGITHVGTRFVKPKRKGFNGMHSGFLGRANIVSH